MRVRERGEGRGGRGRKGSAEGEAMEGSRT